MQVDLMHAPQATGEIRYTGLEAVKKECADFRRALDEQKSQFVEPFMTAASPGIVAAAMLNAHYPSVREYVMALGAAFKTEYETIVKSGFVLQIDAPDLAMERHTSFAGKPLKEFLDFVDVVIARSTAPSPGLPKEKIRLHVCWGNYEGPHTDDVPLDEIIEHIYRAKVSALLLSMANPRHEHDYHSLKKPSLPAGMKLIVGAIDSTTNYVEHPEVVADRIERAAQRDRRSSPRDGRDRLRLRHQRGIRHGSGRHRVGKIARAIRRRRDRQPPPLRIMVFTMATKHPTTGNGFAAKPA